MTIISAVFMFFVTSSMQGDTGCGFRPLPLDAADIITSDSNKDEKFKGGKKKIDNLKNIRIQTQRFYYI